jgi:hypothetical protein
MGRKPTELQARKPNTVENLAIFTLCARID